MILPIVLNLGNLLGEDTIFQCVVLSNLHIYCPGCGGTRGVISLLKGNILDSLLYNPISLFLFVVFIIFFIDATKKVISPRSHKWFNYKPALYIIVVLIIYTFIIRNILAVYFDLDYIGDVMIHWK